MPAGMTAGIIADDLLTMSGSYAQTSDLHPSGGYYHPASSFLKTADLPTMSGSYAQISDLHPSGGFPLSTMATGPKLQPS